jgi:membrane-associated phospholipid phosphatase
MIRRILRPSSRALRTGAWALVATGVAAPLLRKRLRIPPPVITATSVAAPVAMCVAVRRSPARDVATVLLQMWGYIAHYEMPNDDPEALERRVKIDYPVTLDRIVGLGTLPGLRLQRAFSKPGRITLLDKVLVWAHWLWFFFPHGTVTYLLIRRREDFPRGAALIYAVFDTGVIAYWVVPTAPPWYAAQQRRCDPDLRRMMVEHGQAFWKDRWDPMYGFLGGNPLAAMPSLHFATSVMAARVLRDAGPVQGALGWAYAATLGYALVHLGEHYVTDLLAGFALAEGVRRAEPRAAPVAARISRLVQRLEARAHA